ncbi:hypothetical protein [Teichococcus oryzae]|uniref:hypothetical protein n=1 Tax=Teichococcus oryzae TaxID=1608942 RepID=UPI001883CE9E|nr:hypothetical protein [Pseudoroseomonas oryzae]
MPPPISAHGDVPNTILENNRSGDWIGRLTLSTPELPLEAELTGAGARFFEASVDHPSGAITILPVMTFDREGYAAGADPVFTFGLRVRLAGGWQEVSGSWSVTLLGIEDAPPSRIFFAAGGFVLESDVGGIIGRVQGGDPDTGTSKLTYALVGQDDWFFEIVDKNILKLREGVDLLGLGGTVKHIMIEVSDGFHEAAFLLAIDVLNTTDEDTTPAPPPVIPPQDPPQEPPGGDGGTDPGGNGPGTGGPGTGDPGTNDPGTGDPGTGDGGGTTPGNPGPETPSPGTPDPGTPGNPDPDPGEPTEPNQPPPDPPPPPPPPPPAEWHVQAQLTVGPAGRMVVTWQAEQDRGQPQPVLLSGAEQWQPPDLVLRNLATWVIPREGLPAELQLADALVALASSGHAGSWPLLPNAPTSLIGLFHLILDQEPASGAALTDQQVVALLLQPGEDQSLNGAHFSFETERSFALGLSGAARLVEPALHPGEAPRAGSWSPAATEAGFAAALFGSTFPGMAHPETAQPDLLGW